MSNLLDKPTLLRTFFPLSDSGAAFLEVLLTNPQTSTVEGRGFFNDPDFLLEACSALIGRYNFCLSNFRYGADQIPSRGSYNQFDRLLTENPGQETARVHSLSFILLFKPDLFKEIAAQAQPQGDEYFMNIGYQIDTILKRLKLTNFCLDYFLSGMVVRFTPTALFQKYPVNKSALMAISKRFLEIFDKEMLPGEHKKFVLTSALQGNIHDPLPGLPGFFTANSQDSMVVSSIGNLQQSDEIFFVDLFTEIFEGRKQQQQAIYAPANMQGLSQNWNDPPPPRQQNNQQQQNQEQQDWNNGLSVSPSPYQDEKSSSSQIKLNQDGKELFHFLNQYAQNKWRWPIYSTPFNKIHRGIACGNVMMMHSDPFGSEVSFQFLMQSAEGFAKEGAGQILVFSKKRPAGELAIASLARHFKANPLDSKSAGRYPDPQGLVTQYYGLFPHRPLFPPCGINEGLDQLLRYLEHDYLLQQKKYGDVLNPLAIIIDNLDEFYLESELQTFKSLSRLKTRLRELNATLWITQSGNDLFSITRNYLSLCDYHLVLDFEGDLMGDPDGPSRPEGARHWEESFRLDPSLAQVLPNLSLARLHFQAHGSHRRFHSAYAYHAPTFSFRELPTQSGLDVAAPL